MAAIEPSPSTGHRPLLPLFIDLSGQPCLVIGAGGVAARKSAHLLKAGAKLTVIAPECRPAMAALRQAHEIEFHNRAYLTGDLAGQRLVVAATDDETLNAEIASEAIGQGRLVNVTAPGHLSNAVIPEVIERPPLQIALFSGGAAPALARQLRHEIEAFLPQTYGRLAAFAANLRDRVKQSLPEEGRRRRFWRGFFAGAAARQVLAGDEQRALALVEQQLERGAAVSEAEVHLVGAGPGDPELLTLRALRLLQQADVVIHDRLVGPEVLALIPPDVGRIDVGKAPGRHTRKQEEINELLIELARQGKRVLRLKGGDPFVFGRGGEELEALNSAGIACRIVPGITAAIACAAAAGIPLTHRALAHGCVFLPGQLCDSAETDDWTAFAKFRQTLVFYMAVNNLEKICTRLIASGMHADTPAALVRQASLPEQQVFTATVGNLWRRVGVEEAGPGILIVGETVRLGEHIGTLPEKAAR